MLARRHLWMLAVLLAMFLAGHAVILYYVSSHVGRTALILSGAITLLVIKHLGLVGWIAAFLRRDRMRNRR